MSVMQAICMSCSQAGKQAAWSGTAEPLPELLTAKQQVIVSAQSRAHTCVSPLSQLTLGADLRAVVHAGQVVLGQRVFEQAGWACRLVAASSPGLLLQASRRVDFVAKY